MKLYEENEPFFITEEVEAKMTGSGYEFELPPIACLVRLCDVLRGLSEVELILQSDEITVQERKYRQNKSFLVD
ncbi:hypothetical protein [Asaia sp. VD9]|uniref:hypothetical protein n=1 Tax=Asaia sp. VD9 TaxID=3081235 RepID=UPI00301B677E